MTLPRESIENRMVWSGQCDECLAMTFVMASDESSAEEQEAISDTWPKPMWECPVDDCDGTIEWNGNDPVSHVFLPRML